MIPLNTFASYVVVKFQIPKSSTNVYNEIDKK